ncbi:siphovirus Gp157 family protein [Edaphobacter dinghuensis]|uniref:Viral Gp157 protein n=1 Tax=Edaphobacter dinghuensis TaxID=1560005 RepID=A0A917HPU6_9BACT|nr:siphovirus Gp157 family protein [Edaphobacter dinghuensis]GGG86562.1 hypothetical protein GCM10011585_33150 [Edaphobacter dinghuensis]
MSATATNCSLFEIDMELDDLMEQIQKQIDEEGEASSILMERFQEFCKAHGEKVDRIARFIQSMEARTQHCRSEANRLTRRARAAESKTLRTKSMVLYYLKGRSLKRIEGVEFTLRCQRNAQDSVVIPSEEELPLAYKTVHVALNGAHWEMLLDSVSDDLRQMLGNAVREAIPDTEAIKLAAARQEKVEGAEVKRGEHLRVE